MVTGVRSVLTGGVHSQEGVDGRAYGERVEAIKRENSKHDHKIQKNNNKN